VIELYQAEWCPYSSAVRERLSELGIPFVARHVAPWPEQRTALVDRTGTDSIPVLDAAGELFVGTHEIFAYLDAFDPPPTAAEHRARYHEHAEARRRDATGKLLERLAPVLTSP
jgi:glutathione S-transferase